MKQYFGEKVINIGELFLSLIERTCQILTNNSISECVFNFYRIKISFRLRYTCKFLVMKNYFGV